MFSSLIVLLTCMIIIIKIIDKAYKTETTNSNVIYAVNVRGISSI